MNCCICGPVKNCGPYLDIVLQNIEKIGEIFDNYVIIISYDQSSDDSLQKLLNYQKKNPKLHLHINKDTLSPFRTHNIAKARNNCLKLIRKKFSHYPFFIMMDFDNVNCKNCNTTIIKKSLEKNNWDALSFNTTPKYYDVWALSIYPYCFSYNHFNNNYNFQTIIPDYVDNLLKKLPPGGLLPCISSFNGFSIYRTNKFLTCYYDGKVRLDLVPNIYIETHRKATNSKKLVYPDYGNVNAKYEDCEHRPFHLMGLKNGAKIMISPEVIFS